MADRKKTPDILGSLLGGSEPEPTIKPESHNTGIPESHKDSLPVRQPTRKPAKKKASAPEVKPQAPGEKEKATFYISSQIVEALEEGWIQLRQLTPKDQRGQISKSLIVELALQISLEELNKKGQASLLAKKAVNK